jgi:hypothetical protein
MTVNGSQWQCRMTVSPWARRDGTVAIAHLGLRRARLAAGEPAIKFPSPLRVLDNTYDHRCY